MPRLHLPETLRAEILVYARETLPEEACGLLLGLDEGADLRAHAVRSARNLHPMRADRFLIDPKDYAQAERHAGKHGWRVLGFWHTHPAGPAEPSGVDLEQARGLFHSFPERYVYVIVSMRDPDAPEFACWRLDESGELFERLGGA